MKRGKNFSKRGQAGIEYMILLGFVTFIIMSILVLAFVYSDRIKDRIKLNQVENFAVQLVNSAETVFFAGEPSKTTIRLYLPEGVTSLEIKCSGGSDPPCPVGESYYLVSTVITSSGENIRSFKSKVPIQGVIPTGTGTKKLSLEAKEDYVQVS